MNKILKEIQKSFDLLDLKKNWDGKGALPMDKEIYIKALHFILKIVDAIEGDTEEFEINLCPDGSVDLNFHPRNARLSIQVHRNGVSYEGGGPHKDDKIKVINSSGGYVSSEIIDWLERNLKKSN
ncbi:MAG: hypothetical protein WC875_03425 [Candidatus Absconditabacterales bacterium]|jgi:hypothetical protein